MNAETIPADVCALVVRVFHDMDNRGERLSLFGLMESAVMADRSTRPAEPAAPVAEVKAWLLGDPATGQWIEVDGHRVEYSRGMGTPAHVLASAFQAERARADAAEQRAADAFARAEKAAQEIAAALNQSDEKDRRIAQLDAAAQSLLASASTTYRKRNGQIGSFEGDDGEMSYIVPFDAVETLRMAATSNFSQAAKGEEAVREALATQERILDRIWEAMEAASCPNREGPYGLYNYRADAKKRYCVRDFRFPGTRIYGAVIHRTDDEVEAQDLFEKLTRHHVAAAAFRAARRSATAPFGEGEDPAQLRAEVAYAMQDLADETALRCAAWTLMTAAERDRDAAEQRAADALARVKELEFGGGFEAAFDAVVRPGSRYENWRPADDPAEIVTDLYNDLEDALARAEKAERRSAQPIVDGLSLANAKALVELFGGDETDMTVEFIPEGHSGPGFYAWCTEYPEDGSHFLGPASEFSSRAAREAQPATDGGEAC